MKPKTKRIMKYALPFVITFLLYVPVQLMLSKAFGMKLSYQLKQQIVPICCWIVMALSLNLVVGISGELSLGHAGFMSIGCYTGIIVNSWLINAGLTDMFPRLVLVFLFAGMMASLVGTLIGIPVMRLRGDYLAIVTLAFGQIIMNVMNCLYVTIQGTKLTFGFFDALPTAKGIDGIVNGSAPSKLIAGAKLAPEKGGFIIGIILIVITLFIIQNLIYSRSGRAIMAVRDNRIAAQSTGVNVTKYRLMAFVISATLAGMAGALFGMNTTLAPSKFGINESIDSLVFVVLGGIGNMSGAIVSTVVLKVLPEQLRFLDDYRMLIYAIVLILVMLFTNSKEIQNVFVRIGRFIKDQAIHLWKLVTSQKSKTDTADTGKEAD